MPENEASVDQDAAARTVYVYEVEPSHADGRGTSGWTVTLVTERMDLTDVLRIMRVAIAEDYEARQMRPEDAAAWVGIKTAKLVTVAHLDPRIAP